MKRAFFLIVAAVLVGAGGVGGWFASRELEDPVTVTETTTATVTTTSESAVGLPAAVEETRVALLEAAESGDYEKLRPLVPDTGFEFTFGDPVAGGAIAYWRELERTSDERPLATLAEILRMPYTLSRGIYVWPFAYDVASLDDLTEHERTLLRPLGSIESVFVEGTGYLGWRAGIRSDGAWVFFVAGD